MKLIIPLAILGIILFTATGCGNARVHAAGPLAAGTHTYTTLDDLEAQLTQQLREAWPAVQRVEISHFEEPATPGELVIDIDVWWNKHKMSGTAMTFYPATPGYYVGSLSLGSDRPTQHVIANVILVFK